MSLDLAKTLHQIGSLTDNLKSGQEDRSQRLSMAVEAMRSATPEDVRGKHGRSSNRPFLWAGAAEGLGGAYWPGETPRNFCVLSVDGSHIDVDRHMPVNCALINIGGCVLKYGDQPDAYLFNTPRLYSGDELYLTEQGSSVTEVPIEGAVLGLKRTIEEIKALEHLIAEQVPQDLPTLALLDGSLVLWGLSGGGYPQLLRDEIIKRGLVPTLDSLRDLSRHRTLALAAYVSLPRSTEVVNSLRLYLCETQASECARMCSNRRSPVSPCSLVNHLLDRDLFERLLEPGQRSSLFFTNSSVVREYGDHQIFFFYLHTGEEIARVELPQWVALDEVLLPLTHTLILDQCERGVGYPVSISEAHEQAVISGPDRQKFRELVDHSLTDQGLPVYTSEKSRSKRLAWL